MGTTPGVALELVATAAVRMRIGLMSLTAPLRGLVEPRLGFAGSPHHLALDPRTVQFWALAAGVLDTLPA